MNESVPLISVIIPTYNRGHLILTTLDSIASQSYSNWECIIVDDGSADDTQAIVSACAEKDNRFKYYKRPADKPKGGNSCRNYGLKQSKGKYVQWFDSDDLMLANNLATKIKIIESQNFDFVVSKSKRFYEDDLVNLEESNCKILDRDLNLENFALFKSWWITMDIMFSRESVQSVTWNETLPAGQEYNFICKYLSRKPKGHFIEETLALRRMHSQSIRSQREDPLIHNRYNFHRNYQTYLDLSTETELRKQLLARSIPNYIHLQKKEIITNSFSLAGSIYKTAGIKAVLVFYLMLMSKLMLNKSYAFYKILMGRLEQSS